MAAWTRNKEANYRILETELLESPPKFPCKANCLRSCDGRLCRDRTCRAAPLHGHPTAPCQRKLAAAAEEKAAEESSSWMTIRDDPLHAEYVVEFASIINAAISCIRDLCPSQERRFFKMIDEAYDHGRMVVWYPKCLDWSIDDVVIFIKNLGFPHFYENCFKKNGIDGNKLYLCNSNRLVDMGIRDWKDIRVITQAIRAELKIGLPKEEAPLRESRTSVQSLYEFWLRKRAFYSLGNEEKAKNYGFRQFLDEYGILSPDEDDLRTFELASQQWIHRLMAAGRKRRQLLIQELRAAEIPAWVENKNERFLLKGVAAMPQHETGNAETTTTTTMTMATTTITTTTAAEGGLGSADAYASRPTATSKSHVHFTRSTSGDPAMSEEEEEEVDDGGGGGGEEEASSNVNRLVYSPPADEKDGGGKLETWNEADEHEGPPSVTVYAPEG